MPVFTSREFFRRHFGNVQVRSLYLTIPGPQFGRIIAAREEETGRLFAQARMASAIPGKGPADDLERIEAALRVAFGAVYKNLLFTLPWVRTTQTDPIAFVEEFHKKFEEAPNAAPVDVDLAWMRTVPREYLHGVVHTLGRTTDDIFASSTPDRVVVSSTDPAHGLATAPPKILAPRAGEIPALIVYSLAPI